MFLDNLSVSLLQICHTEELSYGKASARCGFCSKHFSNIIARKTCPSLDIFEQICLGFQKTPDQLLGVALGERAFRLPLPVTERRIVPSSSGMALLPVCPRCGSGVERPRQAYCDHCGQCLDWRQYQPAAPGRRS